MSRIVFQLDSSAWKTQYAELDNVTEVVSTIAESEVRDETV
jgi:acyl carrier protein phosphodiesterase